MAIKNAGQNISKFVRSVWAELKKVSWPNRKEITVYTIVVLSTVVVVSIIIGLFDSLLSVFFSKVVKIY